MYVNDLEAFNALLDSLGSIFGKAIDEPLRRMYWEALKPIPLTVVKGCATTHIATGKFFPKPAELRPEPAPGEKAKKKGPDLYSQEWWDLRVAELRRTFPRGLSRSSRASLDAATFGAESTPQLEAAASACYDRAWPELIQQMDPFG